jgi:hypothetical protein
LVELTAERALREGMAASLHYKDVFKVIKEANNDLGFEKSSILAVEFVNTQQQI